MKKALQIPDPQLKGELFGLRKQLYEARRTYGQLNALPLKRRNPWGWTTPEIVEIKKQTVSQNIHRIEKELQELEQKINERYPQNRTLLSR